MPLSRIAKVVVRFSPLTPEARSAREFLARISSGKARASNPQCEIVTSLRVAASTPTVSVTYTATKQTETIDTSSLTADRIFERMQSITDELDSSETLSKIGGTSSKLSSMWDAARNDAGASRRSEPVQG